MFCSSNCHILWINNIFFFNFQYSYLLILDRTNWRTNMLTSLLVPYIFFSLPTVLFSFFRWQFLLGAPALFNYFSCLNFLFWLLLNYIFFNKFYYKIIQRRGREMDCFHCSCTKAFHPTTLPRYMLCHSRLLLLCSHLLESYNDRFTSAIVISI